MRIKLGSLFFALSLVTGISCGSDSDTTGTDGSVAKDGGAGTTGSDGPREAGASDSTAAVKYTAIMIVDKDTDNVACSATNGPGADIDAVELRTSAGVLVGVGMKGTASFAEGGSGVPSCTDSQCSGGKCKYSDKALVTRIEGVRDGKVNQSTDDVGYFSLNNNRVALQIGDMTGTGPAKEITSGMTIKVWEVDQVYKADGNAFAGCVCAPERYEVWLLTTPGSNVGAKRLTATMFQAANDTQCKAMGMQTGGMEGCGTSVFMVP